MVFEEFCLFSEQTIPTPYIEEKKRFFRGGKLSI